MKLRTKFLLSLLLVTTGLTGASLFIVRRSVRLHARKELSQELVDSAARLRDFQDQRELAAERSAELLAAAPLLKAMMVTHDPATIQDASLGIWHTAGADLFALAGPSGEVMALHNNGRQLPQAAVKGLLAPRNAEPDWWSVGGRVYQVFYHSVDAGSSSDRNSLGVLAVGYEVGPLLAQQISRVAGAQVGFRTRGRIVAGTLNVEQTLALQALARVPPGHGPQQIELGGEAFMTSSFPLSSRSGDVELIVLKSFDRATVFMTRMNRLIIGVGVVAVLLGAGFVLLVSHTFTRPLGELVTGVRALSKGDFSFPLKVTGNDEVAELTSAFDRMRSSLEETQKRMVNSARLEAVGQLAGGVAHDFNNLITIIKGYTDLLLSELQPGDPGAKYAEEVRKAGDRAASLTRQLLAFSRKQVLQPQAVELNLVIANLQNMLKVLVGEHIELITLPGAGLPEVLADPGQMEQVIMNLVVNARDAMPNGGKIEIRTATVEMGKATAAARGVKPGRYVRLSVADTGCGMTEATLKQIFQPFFTTKEVGKGTGLGLAIVYGVVKQSGGVVEVESKLGEGSTFHVFLPELTAESAAITPEQDQSKSRAGTEKILVVEDEAGVRNMVREALVQRGYKVLEARNGEEALRVFEEQGRNIDLLLMDVVMPKGGGLDVAERLRACSPKILLMSGYTDRINEIEKSRFHLLYKPFAPDTLAQRIREVLDRRSATSSSSGAAPSPVQGPSA
ncbi:MAG TPA: ATP-binding protein [Terriglobales bacterium]|nr:ATP-binding protein [Terriglobales bacterium]